MNFACLNIQLYYASHGLLIVTFQRTFFNKLQISGCGIYWSSYDHTTFTQTEKYRIGQFFLGCCSRKKNNWFIFYLASLKNPIESYHLETFWWKGNTTRLFSMGIEKFAKPKSYFSFRSLFIAKLKFATYTIWNHFHKAHYNYMLIAIHLPIKITPLEIQRCYFS